MTPGINPERLMAMLEQQAAIGATEGFGLARPALSELDVQARRWFADRVRESGLELSMDGAGNQSVTLFSEKPDAKTLLIGSHLDTVPNGGRYDGVLGVLSGFEVLLALRDAQIQLPFHLEVINFTDEEGTLRGVLGSSAAIGHLSAEDLAAIRGGMAELEAGLGRIGSSADALLHARRDFSRYVGYLEAHIEQGTRLETAHVDIGVVTSIVGVRSYWLTFGGEAAHAGTRPMPDRKDALWGASHLIQQAREHVLLNFQPGVVNFGRIALEPGAFNIVPAQVQMALEFRHGDPVILEAMEDALLTLARQSAEMFGLTLEIRSAGLIAPAPMDLAMVELIEVAAKRADLSHMRLMSFAGHDAQMLARVTPSVMFFVPCLDGVSHNPAEYCAPEDCAHAAQVLLEAVLLLAEKSGDEP
jgi:hydantoinase/carbamoylase family amidase